MTNDNHKALIAASDQSVIDGALRTDLKGATEMAETRLRVGGLLPCLYPRAGGGCFLASVVEGRIKIEELIDSEYN